MRQKGGCSVKAVFPVSTYGVAFMGERGYPAPLACGQRGRGDMPMPKSAVVRVEGVNFETTLLDTDDLSTIRGGSLTLLALGVWLRYQLMRVLGDLAGADDGSPMVKEVSSGASHCALLFDYPAAVALDDVASRLRKAMVTQPSEDQWREACRLAQWAEPPVGDPVPAFAHVTTVLDCVPCPDGVDPFAQAKCGPDSALRPLAPVLCQAEARNHARQFRQWTVDPLPMDCSTTTAGVLDRFGRPGTEPLHRADRTSRAVWSKRQYGRCARQTFYDWELFNGDLGPQTNPMAGQFQVTDSFVEIVNSSGLPKPDDLPLSVQSKIAVFYADGNGFGAIRDDVGVQSFSQQLKTMRRELLRGLLRWWCDQASDPDVGGYFAVSNVKSQLPRLRFETLLWGGDEMMFVLPGWLALPFAETFDRLAQGWTLSGHSLTHAMGMVIADGKTPIRQLSALARASADAAKAAGLRQNNTLTIDVFESQSPPDKPEDLARLREASYGVPGDGVALASRLAIPLANPEGTLQGSVHGLATVKQEFPRSQLYAALQEARRSAEPLAQTSVALEKRLSAYAQRMGKNLDEVLWRHRLPSCDGERSKALDVALICALWDYLPGDWARRAMGVQTKEGV